MKDQIKNILQKRGMYTLDLYRILEYQRSFESFKLLLNSGLRSGDWICEDGFWQLPRVEPETHSVDATPVSYLLNTSFQFQHPADKHKLDKSFFSHSNYQLKTAPVSEMIADNLNGYQIVPGLYERKADGSIRLKECWQNQQVVIAEFDKRVKSKTLAEVVERSEFLRENAFALVASMRSGYDDPTDDTCNGELRFRAFFLMPRIIQTVKAYEFIISELLKELPTADPGGSSIVNGAFGLKDAEHILLNQFVSNAMIERWRANLQKQQETQNRWQPVDAVDIQEIPLEYREQIGTLTYRGDSWGEKMFPCIFNNHQHDGWNSERNAMGVFRHSDKRGWTFHCFKCNEKRSYRIKPRNRDRRRVKRLADTEAVYQSLEKAQIENKRLWDYLAEPRAFDRNRQVIGVSTDTGVGKDYSMLIEARQRDVFSLNPHGALSEQLHTRSKEQNLTSYYIRPRHYGFQKIADAPLTERIARFKKDPDVLCIHADRCDALIARTGDCTEALCNKNDCEVYSFCKEQRYLSQVPKAAQSQIAHYSWVTLCTDPSAKGIVAKILAERKRYDRQNLVWVVGEVDAHKLLNRHRVSTAEIKQGFDIWGDSPAGQLYQLLSSLGQLHLTQEQRFELLVEGFHKIEFKKASYQLARVGEKFLTETKPVSISKAIESGYISVKDVMSIHQIPKIYPQGWTLVEQIEQFLSCSTSSDPPIFFDGLGIEFVTPPDLHSMCDQYVLQSATANLKHCQELLSITADNDLSFTMTESERVEHHPDAKMFKILTGRYVRSSCFEYKDGYKTVVGLRDTIRPHLENLLQTLQNTPGEKFVNTYKVIYEGDELADDPLIQELRLLEDVQWSNWAAGYGLDLPPETIMIEFGTNEPSELMLKNACSELYMSDDVPLSYEFENFHEHDGIRIEKIRTYKDERVQKVYEQITEMSQYQMANRTRPVRNPSIVLIYSSHPCKWLDGRVQWITPSMLGGDLRRLQVDEPKSDFQSKKSEKQRLAYELAKEGLTNTEIAVQLGYKSKISVWNLLKEFEV